LFFFDVDREEDSRLIRVLPRTVGWRLRGERERKREKKKWGDGGRRMSQRALLSTHKMILFKNKKNSAQTEET
jgi:hypothetical protein